MSDDETICECGHSIDDHRTNNPDWFCDVAGCRCEDFRAGGAAETGGQTDE